VVLNRREHILMLSARGKGILGTILRYRNEVRDEKTYFDDIPAVKIAPDMLDLATHIVETKAGHFDPDRFDDRYEHALSELIQAKQSGRSPPSAPTPRPSNVVNLMDALRRSVKAERQKPSARATRSKSTRRAAISTKRRKLRKAG
jgi:DNA end-binding protein Ku